jgi:ABC-type branched-subunit amino acid transport system ATPase component
MTTNEKAVMLEVSELYLRVGRSSILNGIDLKITQGETVGIVGPNGSGKTTLFNCLSGFLEPYRGEVKLNSKDIIAKSPSDRALMGIGRTFQNFGIFKEMTVEENIVTALEARKSFLGRFFSCGIPADLRSKSLDLLKEVGIEGKLSSRASSLSGGQMRLLEIVRLLAFEAELFLLDEPTAGVSPKMKDDVANLILKLKSQGKTVLIIEHDMQFIQRFCDRIIVLESGKVVMDGSPKEVRENPRLQEIYFGVKH